MMQLVGSLLPLVLMIVVFWFLIIRPSAKRAKQHQEMLTNLKRGDTVFTSGGLIGKIKSLTDDEVRLELNQNVEVRVLRRDIGGVRTKAEPAPANDSKA
jgi:preprotein translocase subunit YajC